MKTLTDCEEYLTNNLDGQEKQRFIDFVDATAAVNDESVLDSFITGFRLGAQFAYDTFVSKTAPYADFTKDEI